MKPIPDKALPGQESVWDYPRPAIAEPTPRHLIVRHRGVTIADTRRGIRTLETSHPPSYYFPPEDVATDLFIPTPHRSLCEWKGQARYFNIRVGDETIGEGAWSYPAPTPAFASIAGHFAFYPHLFDTCLVDGERAVAQPGGFYGGWVTADLAGPFKGGPGSRFW
ncbi:hypothetical protein COC42_09045 [Sphingomonas spermidinifaciens]|uniref:DUF427 domain-containing protein n=1 Tax=Sphingomonas spermidinifaciens TaxID=1141889 RepID=A0A2A4B8K7_9SPHN|nr:DUF427 domain-containing protein [Sphingomonas spermidinifaciens]PCD04400.1 hypothetical protein COC42_09045 [Sphingomonas spermidinifaciens]